MNVLETLASNLVKAYDKTRLDDHSEPLKILFLNVAVGEEIEAIRKYLLGKGT